MVSNINLSMTVNEKQSGLDSEMKKVASRINWTLLCVFKCIWCLVCFLLA